MSATVRVHPVAEGTVKVRRVRRLRWRRDLGPWGNGFDHGWRDSFRGVHLPTPSVREAARLTPAERETYEHAYHEAVAILRGVGEVVT